MKEKKRKKNKVQRKVKRNLGPNFVGLTEGIYSRKDTWERLENLENTMNLVENFEKDIRRVQTRKEKEKEKVLNPEAKVFRRSKLLGKYMAKILFEWDNRKFENKYLKKLERSWVRWKEKGRQVFLEMKS